MTKDELIAAYDDFKKWCLDNPHHNLDSRPHTHGGAIGDGGYISHEKTRIAFAAWRAAIAPHKLRIAEMEAELEAIGAGGVSGQRITGGRQRGEPSADDSLTIAYMSGCYDGKRSETPEGWQLVPKEPTHEMIVAFVEQWYCYRQSIDDPQIDDAYQAMLSAAPKFGEEND